MKPVAREAIALIVKRTRLGYGVSDNFGQKQKFPALSAQYIAYRREFKRLSSTTSAKKSNLTLTGQLLNSIGIISENEKGIKIGPQGTRDEGFTNAQLTEWLEKRHGRVYLKLSDLEFKQLVRFYRKTFGDLLKKKDLLR